jgi:hypothetical protein
MSAVAHEAAAAELQASADQARIAWAPTQENPAELERLRQMAADHRAAS